MAIYSMDDNLSIPALKRKLLERGSNSLFTQRYYLEAAYP